MESYNGLGMLLYIVLKTSFQYIYFQKQNSRALSSYYTINTCPFPFSVQMELQVLQDLVCSLELGSDHFPFQLANNKNERLLKLRRAFRGNYRKYFTIQHIIKLQNLDLHLNIAVASFRGKVIMNINTFAASQSYMISRCHVSVYRLTAYRNQERLTSPIVQ